MSLYFRLLAIMLSFSYFAGLAAMADLPMPQPPPDKEKIAAALDANDDFTPLLLPGDAAAYGLSLSGEARVCRPKTGQYRMRCGCVLVHAVEPVYFNTCRADVLARSGATVVISTHQDVTRVLNLSDRKHDSVRVIFGKNHVSLNPGEELAVVSATAPQVEKAANEYVIRYRNAQSLNVSPQYKAVLFEFSLADAMRHCLIFKQLNESPRKEDKALLKEIIKTAAALNTMFMQARGKYTHGQTNAVIAKKRDGRVASRGRHRADLALSSGSSEN